VSAYVAIYAVPFSFSMVTRAFTPVRNVGAPPGIAAASSAPMISAFVAPCWIARLMWLISAPSEAPR
jgi:hypothetical protein